MERRHRSGRRESESRRKEGGKHHHHESHRHRKPTDEHNRHEKTTEHRSGTREWPSIEDPAALPLSQNKDYVRNWLANTNADDSVGSRHQRPREAPQAERESKLARQFAYLENHDNPNQNNRVPPKPKKKHNTSSDSSLLEPQFFCPEGQAEEAEQTNRIREQSPRPHKRSRATSTAPSCTKGSTHRKHPKETFEKRARHKTREDRYEPKDKEPKADKTEERKRTTTKRTKKKSNRKPKKHGEELMRDFTSKSIGQDRLTIRPPYSLGLFSNGRTSNNANDKGIPDLAFSDMDFLQNTERSRPTIEMEHSRSKSRDKEKRKVLKGREEIEDLSIFFNQYRKPLQEVSNNTGRGLMMENSQARIKPPDQIRFPESQLLYAKQIDHSPIQGPQAPSLVSAGKYTDSASKVSGKPTTYLSWSETQFSPAKCRLNTDNRRQLSPIPDAIQRSIEKTGIYRDTGIEMRQHPLKSSTRDHTTTKQRQPERRHRSPKERQRNRHHVGDAGGIPQETTLTSTSPSHETQSSLSRHRTSQQRSRHARKHAHEIESQAKAFNIQDSNTPEISSNRPPTIGEDRGNPIVEHFDRDLGWNRNENLQIDHQHNSESLSNSAIPETPFLDRAQLAKNAKVKRPSTTLPIVPPTATGIFPKEHNDRPATTEPTTTGIMSQLPQSAQLEQPSVPAHVSMRQNTQAISVQPVQNLERDVSTQQVSVESRAEDVVVPTQGPTPQSLAASLHQSRGSSSTIRNNQEASALGSSNLLGRLPLRGGLVHQFDPESRMSTHSSQEPLFIRQAQQHDFIPQHTMPGVGQPQIATSMNFFNIQPLAPPAVHSYRPQYTERSNIGILGMEPHAAAIYPEDEAYDDTYYDADHDHVRDRYYLEDTQETLLNDNQYANDPPQEMEYPDSRVTANWHEGGQYQQQDVGLAYYDEHMLAREESPEILQDGSRLVDFVSNEGFIQRTNFENGNAYHPEDLWRHQQLY